ncbi:MAG: phosphate acyltransferase PlsX [Planctomycetes bacterium]|nr:phosphate acyltransferase PlsX [Planctomycetota bacterium]
MRIAVDAMGGDAAPSVVVEGALLASRYLKDHKVILVGDEVDLKRRCALLGGRGAGIEIVHAPEVVDMHEPPIEAVRKKRGASICAAAELVKEGRADALVSAGNTGAAVAASCLKFGFLPGVRRAGIAAPMPTRQGKVCVLIDAGANMAPTPTHLLHYGIMAEIYSKIAFDVEAPRVGLLNVGAEDAKGHSLAKEAFALLRDSHLDFRGNVEGGDIFEGRCNIVVCEGFAGNAILKAAEGIAQTMLDHIRTELKMTIRRRVGAVLCKTAFAAVKSRIDCSEYGGAPLLGVNGITIISHGGADAKAIFNGIRVAGRLAKMDLNTRIINEIEATIVQGSK